MAPVIAIPYGARILRMPPPGVNTEGLVELVTTPLGSRGAAAEWSYPDFVDLRDADTGIAMTGWAHGESKTTIQTAAGVYTESVRLVFRRVGVFIVAGLAVGVAGSWWAATFIAPLLFQVEARDPMTFSGTAAVLVAVGVLAAWVPARRAARLDPATVLREG